MASSYSDLLIQIVADVGDVNPNYAEIVFRRCLNRFMEMSQVWRTRANFDMASASPDPITRQALVASYQAALAAAQADPGNIVLAQAAADARVAAYAPPQWTLTPPVLSTGPTVYYAAIATGMRVTLQTMNATPYWRINPAAAAGGFQTLEILPPLASQSMGAVCARLFWTPKFDADTDKAIPSWVYERYGGSVSDWTIGTIWMQRRGRRSDQAMGQKMSNDAMNDARRVCARANMEDPIPMSM